ncbi:MAG: hypothetical protein J5533_03430 [Bacteroidales bacterium]|nr:hypothetical protein [Bacteroidales bacterium]
MKHRIIVFAALIAALAIAAACRMEEPEQNGKSNAPKEEVYQVHFVAEEIATKTVFGEAEESDGNVSYPTLWSGNDEQIAVSLNLSNFKGAAVSASQDGKKAEFDAEFSATGEEDSFTFFALSPFSACVGASSSHGGYHLNIPTEQTPLATSCDEAAQLLVASQTAESVDQFGSIELNFSHVTAYGKLTLKNMNLPEGDTVLSIDLTASVPFAGRFYYSFDEEALSDQDNEASRTITILPDNLTVADGSIADIWFACAPADLGGGSVQIVVNTTTGKLSRTVEIPTGKLAFNVGRISKFSVNMANAEFDQPEERWVLVSDASKLQVGDEIIIASSASAGSAYAISTTQNRNNRGRAAVTIAKDADGQMIIQNPGSTVEVLRLLAGYYSGYFYLQEATSTTTRYLYTTSSNTKNYLYSGDQSTASNSTNRGYSNWKISITSSVAYISSYNASSGSYKQIRHNSTDKIYSAYKSTSQTSWTGSSSDFTDVYIYRKQGGGIIADDPILDYDKYGAYLESGNHLYSAGLQLSREYSSNGEVTFAIISPVTLEVAEFSGIPTDPAKGDSFTLTYNQITGRNQTDADYNVTVVKVDGPKVWLSAGSGYGFIVKK